MARMDLRQLRKDLTHIEAEVAKLQKKAQDFRGVIAFYEEAGEGAGPSKTPGKELDDTIVLILEAEGKPLHPKTVCGRLIERGIDVPGQNPVNNVRAHMSGDERCVSIRKDGLWGLKTWGQPQTSNKAGSAYPASVDDASGVGALPHSQNGQGSPSLSAGKTR